MLSSPSMANADNSIDSGSNGKRANNKYGGGSIGTNGDAGLSSGTGSSGSYGSGGLGQQDSGLSGSAYQHSGSAFGGSALSSGYGSGTNTFGASAAFSDYPIGQSTGSGPQMYAAQQQQQHSSSNNNNSTSNYNTHHLSPSNLDQSADSYGGHKLRQAKKTIIPIVVQVEHAILENNAPPMGAYQQSLRANKNALNRQPGRGKRGRHTKSHDGYRNSQPPFGAATNDLPMELQAPGAQYINAANVQDINQITAAINAENAANAAAALAQADMAFGGGAPAYVGNAQGSSRHPNQQQHFHNARPHSQYASGLQSAASALLANTHPMLQAAASGGLASVSKLGAKLGEMIALPSMQVPNPISTIGASLPSALSSITSQVGVQLNQAVQQVAKEHPTAHAFARQVAQQAGLHLPNFSPGPNQNGPMSMHQQQQHQGQQQGFEGNMQQMAASNQHQQSSLSPQAQLQNLKLSIGQNLQTAAAQLIGAHQKANAQSAASLLANPLAALYPQSMNAALKQMSAGPSAFGQGMGQQSGSDQHYAQSSSVMSIQPQLGALQQQQQQPGQGPTNQQAASSDPQSFGSQSALVGESSSSGKQVGKSTLKSKFLSFFQPPKFISNLLSWNDRADDRNDQGVAADVTESKAQESSPKEKKADESSDTKESQAKAVAPTNSTSGEHARQEVVAKVAPESLASNVQPEKSKQEAKSEVVASVPSNATSSAQQH